MLVMALAALVAVAGGTVADPLLLAGINAPAAAGVIAFILALFARERAWIQAGQAVPIS